MSICSNVDYYICIYDKIPRGREFIIEHFKGGIRNALERKEVEAIYAFIKTPFGGVWGGRA
jgi:hypothetical protein